MDVESQPHRETTIRDSQWVTSVCLHAGKTPQPNNTRAHTNAKQTRACTDRFSCVRELRAVRTVHTCCKGARAPVTVTVSDSPGWCLFPLSVALYININTALSRRVLLSQHAMRLSRVYSSRSSSRVPFTRAAPSAQLTRAARAFGAGACVCNSERARLRLNYPVRAH